MKNYKRLYIANGCYFFTVVTYKRIPLLIKPQSITRLKEAFRYAIKKKPFRVEALVILPDHLHCIWRLPEYEDNFSIRWNLIKRYFSIGMEGKTNIRREKNIWQNRFWEHAIKNEQEYWKVSDYIHYNPVKHKYVNSPFDWQYSSFHKFVEKGFYDKSWGSNIEPENIKDLYWE